MRLAGDNLSVWFYDIPALALGVRHWHAENNKCAPDLLRRVVDIKCQAVTAMRPFGNTEGAKNHDSIA